MYDPVLFRDRERPLQIVIGGVIPFVATDLVRLVILILFPLLATWLPQHMGN